MTDKQYKQSQWGSEGLSFVACCGCQDISFPPFWSLCESSARRSVVFLLGSLAVGRKNMAGSRADNPNTSVWFDQPVSSSSADGPCLPKDIAIVAKAKDSTHRRRNGADRTSAHRSGLSQRASQPSRHKAENREKIRPLSLNIPDVEQSGCSLDLGSSSRRFESGHPDLEVRVTL